MQGLEAGRRRLRDEAVRPCRAAQPHPRRAAPRRAAPLGRRAAVVGPVTLDRGQREVTRRGRARAPDVLRVRAARLPDGRAGPPVQPPGAAARDLGRLAPTATRARSTSTSATCARSSRSTPEEPAPDRHRPRRRIPLCRGLKAPKGSRSVAANPRVSWGWGTRSDALAAFRPARESLRTPRARYRVSSAKAATGRSSASIQLVVSDDAGSRFSTSSSTLEERLDCARSRPSTAAPALRLIVHAGRRDVALLRRVAQTAGDERLRHAGRSRLRRVERSGCLRHAAARALLGVRIQKSASYTRWDRRPLNPEQLAYAREDVLHLLEMASELERRLARSGRLEWALEECRPLEQSSDVRDPELLFGRLPRINSLSPSARAIALALVRYREQVAEQQNRPIATVLSDIAIVELAKRAPRSPEQLEQIRGVNPGNMRRRGVDLLAVIADGAGEPRNPRSRGERSRAERPDRRPADRALRGARARAGTRGWTRLRADRGARRPRRDRRARAPWQADARGEDARRLAARARRRGVARAAARAALATPWHGRRARDLRR